MFTRHPHWILLLLSAAVTLPAHAQSDDLSFPTSGYQDIVVTAQKRAENIRDVPINITALSGAHLANLQMRDVQDMTAYVPSFRVTSPGNAAVSALSLRGVGQRDINVHNEGAVALFVDGAYVSFIPAIAQPLFDIERVEVLKGPQGTLFGRNATGGLINVVTRRPSQEFDAYATLQYGSYNELKAEGAVGGPLSGVVSARASVNYTRSDGYVKNDNGPALNANDSLMGRLQVLVEPSDDFSYLVSARGWRVFDEPGAGIAPTPYIQDATGTIRSPLNYQEYANFCLPLTGGVMPPAGAQLNGSCFVSQPDRFRGSYSPEIRYHQSYYGFTGTGEWNISDAVTLTSITDYQHLSNHYVSDIDATPNRIFNYGIDVKSSKQFSQELRLSGETDSLKWVGGFYYLSIDHHILNTTDLYNHPGFGILLPADYVQHTRSYALFGQIDWEFAPQFTLSLGLRGLHDKKTMHNDSTCISNPVAPPDLCDILGSVVFPGALAFNRTFDGTMKKTDWSGRAVLQYKPSESTMIYGGVTRGTKGGGYNSGGAEFYPFSAVAFKPETLTSYEAGIKATTPDRVFGIDGSFFYYDYKNYQSYSVSTDGGLRVLNVDATIKGIELALNLQPVNGLSLNVAGAWLDAKQKNVPLPTGGFHDFQVPDAPKWSFNAELRYATRLGNRDDELAMQLNAVYVSDRSISAIDFPDQHMPSYHRFDARITYTLPGNNWSFAAFANNFTNETIVSTKVDFTTVTGNTVDTLDRPRWFGASVTWRY